MTPEQARLHLINTDPRFEVCETEIRGARYRVFRNVPPHVCALLWAAEKEYGDREVLIYRDERWDYPAFCRDVKRMAEALANQLGVRQGDHVALAMRNYPELPILLLAVAALGAVAVPLNAWSTEQELAYALGDCGAKVVFADGPRYERILPSVERLGLRLVAVREAEAQAALTYTALRASAAGERWPDVEIAPDDDFAVLYSSGSTGNPKGVVLTHRGAISAVYSWLFLREMAPLLDNPPPPSTRPPASLIITPLFHVTALHSNFLQGLITGTKMALMHRWDAEEAVRIIEAEQISRFLGVPTQSADLMETARRLGVRLESLEQIGAGGAKRPAAQVGQLAQVFPAASIGSGWGMTETNALGITISGPEYVANPEAAGRLTPPLQDMRIVDDEGNDVPVGQVGELIVKSPANMRCYLNRPEDTAQALRDGWLYTGDLARMDEQGLVYIVDRKKTIIIRGGENISCLEVEGALHRHPAVAEACVFPVPDARLGEVVGAGVTLKPGARASEQELKEFLAQHIAHFKIPERIWFWPEPLPRGATGKLDRRTLRNQCLSGAGSGAPQQA